MDRRKKIALVLVYATAILAVGRFTVHLVREDLKPRKLYYAKFAKVIGLKEKDPVTIQGVLIGRVKEIELHRDANKVTLELDPTLKLRRGAHADIVSRNLFGDVEIKLKNGDPKQPPLAPGTEDIAISGSYQTSLSATDPNSQKTLSDGLAKIEKGTRLMNDPVEGGRVGQWIAGKDQKVALTELLDQLDKLTKAARDVLVPVKKGQGLGALFDKRRAYPVRAGVADLRKTVESARDVLGSASRGETGILGALAGDPYKGALARESLRGLASGLQRYERSDADAPLRGFFARDERPYRRFAEASGTLSDWTGAAIRGEGVLGMLTSEEGGRAFKARLGSLESGLGEALAGRSGLGKIFGPQKENQRAVEEVVNRVKSALQDFRGAINGLRSGQATSTLQGSLFTVF